MRRIYIYILALLALSAACQRIDLPEDSLVDQPAELPIGAIGSKATITFSTADLVEPETKGVFKPEEGADKDPSENIKTLHLIVFDENGMLVEICEAKELGSSDHDGHQGGRHYTVTLTVTDKPRFIHYVANCPVSQVVYGHETSIIGNMYVDRNNWEHKTEYETSYWARIEVPYILVEEKEEVQTDGSKKIVVSLHDSIANKFKHVPLLRNYAEITVTDKTGETFGFEGFIVYNLLNRGTVAPYNSNTQEFQSFIYTDQDTQAIKNYSYPQLLDFNYEGHALTSAQLVTDFIRNDDGTVKIYKSDEPFYVYERKVSVMTDEEEKWRESPPHIIIKGRYNNGEKVTDKSPVYYYKMDLVYTEKDTEGNEEIKYYNILRNFMYQFNLTDVHDVGYGSLEEAVAGTAGNNISGSSSTSKLTNVSDNEGRLWVSYTDTTLVTGNAVSLKYKYIPNYYDSTKEDYQKVQNGSVRFENIFGDVITGIDVASDDIDGNGTWAGYRNVTVSVKKPGDIICQQYLSLQTNSAHLNRKIRYTLRPKLTMEVECTPKVSGSMMQPVTVDIKLPIGMTEDMFPLMLNMETYDRTLSPDAAKNYPAIPVTTGTSIIDANDRRGQLSYYYVVTISTYEAYKALPNDGNMKLYTTYWLTNKADNASTVYVDNKYFNQASDSWQNYKYTFSNASCISPAAGVGNNVTISFSMADGAINKPVTISLVGMSYTGQLGGVEYTDATVVTYTPSSKNVNISGFKTTTATDPVSFTLDADEYDICGPVEGTRQMYQFDGEFVGVTSLVAEENAKVYFTFNIPEDAFNALKSLYPDAGDAGVPMFVTLDRMHPADDQLVYSQVRANGDRYIYRVKNAGQQKIYLATTEAAGGTCAVTLEADCFDTQTKEIKQVGRQFRSLKITNDRIAQGTGRRVNITFQLDEAEGNDVQKDVTVTLVNMTINGEHTVTLNTGDSNAVTNENGTYTIKNVVTADDPAGQLKVSITAKGYSSKEATFDKVRPTPKFTTSLSKTSLGADANEEVVLNFSSEDLVDGMNVTLELDGLRPKDNLPTKAVTSYVYTVEGTETQIITLVTTESTTTNKTCTVQLKAEGFVESEVMSIKQTAATHAMMVRNNRDDGQYYDAQVIYTLPKKLENGSYTLTFDVRAPGGMNNLNNFVFIKEDLAGGSQIMRPGNGNVTGTWQSKTITFNVGPGGSNGNYYYVAFNIGKVPSGTYIYFDNVSLKKDGTNEELIGNWNFEEGHTNGWFDKCNAPSTCEIFITSPGYPEY